MGFEYLSLATASARQNSTGYRRDIPKAHSIPVVIVPPLQWPVLFCETRILPINVRVPGGAKKSSLGR